MVDIVTLAGLAPMRQRAGISQAELARRLDVTRQAVCGWEAGTIWPTPDRLPKIADVLSCTIDELYGRAGETEEAWKKSN